VSKLIEEYRENEEENADPMAEILNSVARNAEALNQIMQLLEAVSKSGLLDLIRALLERYNEALGIITEEASKERNVRAIRNLLSLYTFVSRANPEALTSFMANLADQINRADSLKKERPLGLFSLSGELKDPDVSAGIRILLNAAKGFTKK